MSGSSNYQPGNRFTAWIEERLPIFGMIDAQLNTFPTPRNLNYWWTFGGILSFCLMAQILTGIVLSMHYTPHADLAFDSVEHVRRNVNWGWLLRNLHAVGASMFFIAVYVHMARGLYYGSYRKPRELLWLIGVAIFLAMMATAFMGYVLPWGQMSFWGATVITNLFSAIPLVGDSIVTWLWGGFAVENPTLNRFYSLHYLLPFVIAALVVLHIWALHVSGNNNPLGIDVKSDKDTLPFHPYYTMKDLFAAVLFFILFSWFVFYSPNSLGHPDNFIEANPLVTPAHIVPEWYFLPFYAILRAVPDVLFVPAKLAGVIAMFGAIAMLALVPWLDTSPVRSARFRPVYRIFFWIFVVVVVVLGWIGSQSPSRVILEQSSVQHFASQAEAEAADEKIRTAYREQGDVADTEIAFHFSDDFRTTDWVLKNYSFKFTVTDLGLLLTIYYFVHFLIILPLLGRFEKTLPVPGSISRAVLEDREALAQTAATAPAE